MIFFIVLAAVATVCTTLAAWLTSLSFGQLVALYYLTAAIAGLVPQLRWPITLNNLKTRTQTMLWKANDEL